MRKVKLVSFMKLERGGVVTAHKPGDIVEVGRQCADELVAAGDAVEVEDALPEPEPRKVSEAGRYSASFKTGK